MAELLSHKHLTDILLLPPPSSIGLSLSPELSGGQAQPADPHCPGQPPGGARQPFRGTPRTEGLKTGVAAAPVDPGRTGSLCTCFVWLRIAFCSSVHQTSLPGGVPLPFPKHSPGPKESKQVCQWNAEPSSQAKQSMTPPPKESVILSTMNYKIRNMLFVTKPQISFSI